MTSKVATSLLPSDRPLEKGQFVGTLRRLMGFARPYRVALWASIGLALGAQLFELAVPWLTGDVIDQAIRPRDTDKLKTLVALMLVAAVLRFVLMTIRRLVSGTMAVSIEYDLRNRTYAHLQKLSFSFYDRNQTGQLMSRATADVGTVRIFLSYGLLFFTQYILTIVGVLAVLLVTDPLLSLVAIAIAPPIVYIAIRYSRLSHPVLTEAQQTLADVTTQAEEAVVGVRVVKAFGQEERETQRFRGKSERIFAVNVRANALRAVYVPLLAFVPALAVAGVLGLGGWMVVHGRITLGDFVRFNLLLGMLILPLRALGMWVGQAQRAVASGVRVLELLDLEPELADPPEPEDAAGRRRRRDPLRGRAVRLRRGPADRLRRRPRHPGRLDHRPDRPDRLRQDDAHHAGAALLRRHRRPRAGRRHRRPRAVAGRPAPQHRRRHRGHVPVLGHGRARTSRSARRGRPTTTCAQAADRAQATEFIESLPDGYETQIGERGLTLSGGQRQRIAIARALLVNPRILILDDATAAVDATTESKIKRALQELMGDRTTIIIAHRLSTISLADRVVVMDRGPDRGRRVARGAGPDERAVQPHPHARPARPHVRRPRRRRVRAAQGGRDRHGAARERGGRLGQARPMNAVAGAAGGGVDAARPAARCSGSRPTCARTGSAPRSASSPCWSTTGAGTRRRRTWRRSRSTTPSCRAT